LMSLTCLWRNCFGSHVMKRKKVAPAIHQLSTFAKIYFSSIIVLYKSGLNTNKLMPLSPRE
jgi:hypothetical protein